MLFFFLLGQNIILSIRIHDPKAVLSLDVIEIANVRKSLTKLKRSRIPGIYLTSLSTFPKVSRNLELFWYLKKNQTKYKIHLVV